MTTFSCSTSVPTTSPFTEQEQLLESLQPFKIQGRDKGGRKILRIVGKFFPARALNSEVLKKYLEEKIFPLLGQRPFCLVYVHTHVQRSENFPGISTLRSIYESLPIAVKENLEAVYFVHPGLQARLFFATFGRFLFSGGYVRLSITTAHFSEIHLNSVFSKSQVHVSCVSCSLYEKLRYINRLEFLWDHMRKGEIEIPEFVYDHDEELEYRPLMDYGLESDHHRSYDAPAMDSAASMYSLRCIS